MPNFQARITAGATTAAWLDPPTTVPTRLNSVSGIVPVYYAVAPLQRVTIACQPDGLAEGCADGLLGGNLFTCFWVEWSGIIQPIIHQPAGFTSLIDFVPSVAGHHLLGIYRPNGGAQCVRFICEAP